jgi:hypothetical protein
MLVGYMRVSTDGDRQVMDLQRDALLAAGVDERHLTKINGRTFWEHFGITSILLRMVGARQTNSPLRYYADVSLLARWGSASSVFGQMPAPTLSRTSSRNSSASARTARERGRPTAQAT